MRSTREIKILQVRQTLTDLLHEVKNGSTVVPLALYRKLLLKIELCNDLLIECRLEEQTVKLLIRK